MMNAGKREKREIISQAKRITSEMFSIPRDDVTKVEDIVENDRYTEVILWWENPENEHWITVRLAMPEGRLLEYDTSDCGGGQEVAGEAFSDLPSLLSLAERLQVAERFLAQHVPDYKTAFSCMETERRGDVVCFSWSQEVGGLPLPQTGCRVCVNGWGKVTAFSYKGKADHPPSWPRSICPPDEVKKRLLQHLHGRLLLVRLHPDLYDMPEDGQGELRLVYDMSPPLLLAAETGKDIHRRDEIREVEPKRTPLPASSSQPVIRGVDNLASYLGLDEARYERTEAEIDPGVLFLTWRRRDRKAPAVEEKTLDALFQQKLFGSVRMAVNTAFGLLVNYARLETRESDIVASRGTSALSLQACWEAALAFLYRVFPEADRFLYRVEAEDEITVPVAPGQNLGRDGGAGMWEDDTQENVVFSFEAYVDDVPIYMGHLTVGVSRANGQIVSYMGLEDHPSVFLSVPRQPAVALGQALERYASELEMRLEWFYRYQSEWEAEERGATDENGPGHIHYTLIYRPYFPKGEVRFIDAMTGEPIRERRHE